MIETIGFVAATLTAFAFFPQVRKTWRDRSCGDLSLGMLLAQSAGVTLWIVYGIALGSVPIVVANSVTLSFSVALLLLKHRYGGA